ncbi:hypothetical protein SNE40_018445 [Patella caerulea]|uniref:SWIM-type domain-containing protein n=1 Tax=Patella caerulea TaxID=87958 RepID=A0AAN8J665_PATCE
MASTSNTNFHYVSLNEDDVPGAKLPYSLIENHSVVQLQRWLHCRQLKSSGNRQELIERVQQCRVAGKAKDIPVSIDGGKWYNLKLQKLKDQDTGRSQIPILPITGWNVFPSVNLPKHFNKGHIHHHIVESVQFIHQTNSEDDEDDSENIEDLHTAKPMRKGKEFFRSGHVQSMKDCLKGGVYNLKAKIMASYSVDTMYDTTLQISPESGFVRDASCTCKASAMGRCNHVCALLFALEDFIEKQGEDPNTCTSVLCEWNKGRKKQKDPKRVTDASYGSQKKKRVDDIISHDPTPKYTRETQDTVNDFVHSMESGPSSSSKSMWLTLLVRQYEDYQLTSDLKDNLVRRTKVLLNEIAIPHSVYSQEIVKEQRSHDWFLQRRVRVTASQSKTIAGVCKPRSVFNILKKALWENHDKGLKTKAMLYGITNEKTAFQAYKMWISGPRNWLLGKLKLPGIGM